jgi:hypothetical protein
MLQEQKRDPMPALWRITAHLRMKIATIEQGDMLSDV